MTMAPLWLYPGFLYGVAAAAIPIVLHLLQRKRRPVPLPTVRFLAQAVKSRFAVRHWVVLLLRCAVIGLLAAAFARPFSEAYLTDRRATVVILDNSCSIQSVGRWDELKNWTRQELAASGANETIGVLAMNPTPTWLVPLGGEPAAAARAIDAFAPGWEATRIEPALRLAGDVLSSYPAELRRVLLVTDHQRTGWIGTSFDQPLAAGVEVRTPPAARPPRSQVFVTDPGVSRGRDGRLNIEVTVGAASAGFRMLRVFSEGESAPLGERRLELTAGERRREKLGLEQTAAGRWVRIELEADDLAADNVAFALTPPAAAALPLLVDGNGAGYDYVRPALVASSTVAPFAQPQTAVAGDWPARAVAVVRSGASLSGANADRLDRFAAAGGAALVFMDATIAASPWWRRHGVDPVALPANATPAAVREWVLPHPFVAGVGAAGLRDLVGWRFQRGWSLPASLDPVAYWSDGSMAVGELRVGRGRFLLCGFSADRRDGDWPISVAFVPFVHRAVRYLFHCLDELPPEHGVRVGEPILLPAGSGQWRCLAGPAIRSPARAAAQAAVATAPGVYAFEQEGRTTLWAANVAAEESELAAWTEGEPWNGLVNRAAPARHEAAVEPIKLAAVDAEQRTGWWGWLLTAAGVLALLELALSNRTAR